MIFLQRTAFFICEFSISSRSFHKKYNNECVTQQNLKKLPTSSCSTNQIYPLGGGTDLSGFGLNLVVTGAGRKDPAPVLVGASLNWHQCTPTPGAHGVGFAPWPMAGRAAAAANGRD